MQPILRPAVDALGNAKAFDRWAKPLRTFAEKLARPGFVKDFLAGTWLGHPLHPVLTDVPIGAWTSSWILDVVGGEKAEPAADALLGVGIVSSLPTAAAGLTDWVDTWGKTRRIGVAHAAGNATALVAFGASLAARRAGMRKLGFVLSTVGIGVASASAYLGGRLSFGRGIGVDNTAFDQEPAQWTEVLTVDDLSDRKIIHAEADGAAVLLFRDGDDVYAISDRCTHRGCSLSDGEVKTGTVICPCHGSTFRLADGGVVRGPATAPQPAYDTRIVEGRVEVKVREPRN
jgi:nitrite reductase/ring-hydroxylating ferredoxin subunit/uncharacterized membrane protein